MFRYVFVFFILSFCKVTADTAELAITNSLETISSPLQGENNFIVYYVFDDTTLEASLKEVMIASLKKIGTVYPADNSKLTEKEKEERVKKGSMIQIVTSSLIEENANDPSKHTKLPVLELSFKMLSGVEILKTGNKQGCVVWEKEKFIGDISPSKEFKKKVIKTFDQIMNDFVEDYKEANPAEKICEAKFFLFA